MQGVHIVCFNSTPKAPISLAHAHHPGSYIFSQTIFSLRAGITSHWHGWVIAGVELAVFLLPFAVAPYLPLFFYGSLLVVFGIEIAGDCESSVTAV